MILTEEEAKTKQCRVGGVVVLEHQPPHNDANRQTIGYFTTCIGPACMAWCWHGDSPAFPGAGPEDNLNPAGRRGYCGKAGKP